MKKLLTTFLTLLIAVASVIGANRLANSTDVANMPGVQLNDYIEDTPFSTASARGQIYVPNAATRYAGIRFGGTIWIDARTSTMANLYAVEIGNGNTIWSGVSDIDNPITIRPFGGQVKFFMNSSSNTARMVLIYDIPNIEFNGFLESHPGMKYPWEGALTGTFGFWISGDVTLNDDPFQLMIDGPSGMNSISIKNVEISGGYCALRIMPGNTNLTLTRFTCERVYMHDVLGGEMFYVGQTTGTPYAVFEEVVIKDVQCVRSATEGIQLQHLIGSATRQYVENFVIQNPAAFWKNPFQQYQDNGGQYATDNGPNTFRNGIIDGAANTALSVLPFTATPSGEPIIIENILFNENRYIGIYTGTSESGSDWIFRNLYFKDFNNTYPELSEGSTANYVISENNDDRMSFINITKDNTRSNLFENSGVVDDIIGTQNDNAMPDIEYRMPSFPGRSVEQIEYYTEEYASWSTRAGDKVAYSTDDIVIRPIVGTGIRYYNCISGHTSSSSTHPEDDATKWEVIYWDESGWPSYHVNHDAGDDQTFYGWDDLRLVADSHWNLLGIGLSSNERNTNYTYFQWYIDDNGDETGMKELAGMTKLELPKSIEDIGRYVRLKAYVKLAGGSIVEEWVNSWTLVN